MCNLKSEFIKSVQYALADIISNQDIIKVTNMIIIKLSEYDLSKACTDIVRCENETEQTIKMFLATKKLEGRSDKTIESYRRRLIDLANVVNKPIKETTIYDLRMYLAYKQMNGCTERTASGYRSVLVSFFNWAYGEKIIDNNPVITLGQIKYTKEIKKPFSKVELELLREKCESVRDRAIIETLLATGCRVGELVKIKQDDIDMTNMEIKVTGKGNKERIVYFDAVTAMWIKKYLETRNDNNNALFTGKKTITVEAVKPLKEGSIRAMLKTLEQKSGVKNVHPHRFRRTLATNLIKRDMSIQEVARILGHSNINTTMTYVYLDDTSVRESYYKRAA